MNTKLVDKLWEKNTSKNKLSKKSNLNSKIKSEHLISKGSLRSFVLYSDDVLNSKKSKNRLFPEDQFTNFLNKSLESKFIANIHYFWPDINNLNNFDLDESDYSELSAKKQERLERIFSLYLTEKFRLSQINKIKIRNSLNQSTPFRVFVILHDDVYKIFLFDPLHLVITDRRTREDNVFENNKSNGTCMSRFFR